MRDADAVFIVLAIMRPRHLRRQADKIKPSTTSLLSEIKRRPPRINRPSAGQGCLNFSPNRLVGHQRCRVNGSRERYYVTIALTVRTRNREHNPLNGLPEPLRTGGERKA